MVYELGTEQIEGANGLWFRDWANFSKNNQAWGQEVIYGREIFVNLFLRFFLSYSSSVSVGAMV